MAHSRIGQVEIFLGEAESGSLDWLDAGIDWSRIETQLSGGYDAGLGQKTWPSLVLLKAILLRAWNDLSDVRLAEALDDSATFWRFWGCSRT